MRLIPRILMSVCLMIAAQTAIFGQDRPLPSAPLPRPLMTPDRVATPQYATPAAYVATPGYATMPSAQTAPAFPRPVQPTHVAAAPMYASPAPMATQQLPATYPPTATYPPAVCTDQCGQSSRNRVQQRWDTQILPGLQASHWGFPSRFEAPSFGASVNRHFNIQIANGQETLLALYYYDFQNGAEQNASKLNATGMRQLARFAPRLLQGASPLRIQPTPNSPQLDEARRREVITQLERIAPGGVFAQRVIVADPGTFGMGGEESMLIHEGFISQPRMAPPSFGGGGFGAN